MKKILALVLAIAMLATFAACGGKDKDKDSDAAATAEYKLGMGVVVDLESSKEAGEKDATAQADATVATVVLDKDGKIVAADLDVAQTKVTVKDGVVTVDGVDLRTKKEKKEDYNMKGVSPIGKEWYEQAAAFVDYCVGKKADEVKGLKTEVKNNHNVAVDADLYAGCTMDISDFIAAFTKACDDAQAKTFTAEEGFKLGLAVNTAVNESTNKTDDKDATAKLYSTFSAVVVDKDGKVLAVINDAIQPSVSFDAAGKITAKTFEDTKRVLKEGYNMKGVSPIGKEWYEQNEFFTNKMVGKTLADIEGIKTEVKNNHNVAVDADLYAGCTMDITAFKADMVKAIKAAK